MTPLPDAPIVALILQAYDSKDFQHSADALAAWFNLRWKKSGYSISADVAMAVLESTGRECRRGFPARWDSSASAVPDRSFFSLDLKRIEGLRHFTESPEAK